MMLVKEYLRENRINSTEYKTVKSAILASLLEVKFIQCKNILYLNGAPVIEFVKTKEL